MNICPRCDFRASWPDSPRLPHNRDYCQTCKLQFIASGLERELKRLSASRYYTRVHPHDARFSLTGAGLEISIDGFDGYHPEVVNELHKWVIGPLHLDAMIGTEGSSRECNRYEGQIVRRVRSELQIWVLDFNLPSQPAIPLYDNVVGHGGCSYCGLDIIGRQVYLDFYAHICRNYGPPDGGGKTAWQERHIPICVDCRAKSGPGHELLDIPILGLPTQFEDYKTAALQGGTELLDYYVPILRDTNTATTSAP